MQFRKCSIAGVPYGKGNTEIGIARLRRLGQLPADATTSSETRSDGAAKGGAFELVNFDGEPDAPLPSAHPLRPPTRTQCPASFFMAVSQARSYCSSSIRATRSACSSFCTWHCATLS